MFSKYLPHMALCLAAAACNLAEGEIQKVATVSIPPQVIESGGVLGQLLNLAGYNFSISTVSLGTAAQLRDTDELTIEAIALRTLLAAESDRTEEALTDPALVGPCRAGQPPISWLHTIRIFIQRQGEPETARLLAQYSMPQAQRDRPDVCGFFLETDTTVNLKDFLPAYETRVEATGRPPAQDTTLGGFVEALYLGRISVSPDTQP